MLSTAAVPEPVISTADQLAGIEPVHVEHAAPRLVLQVEELALAMTEVRLQQAAAHALAQRDRTGVEQQHQRIAPMWRINRVLTSTGPIVGRGRSFGVPLAIDSASSDGPSTFVARTAVERRDVVAVGRARIAARGRDAGERDGRRDRRLSAGRLVLPVVEQHVLQVRRTVAADRRERAEPHQRGAVAIDRDDVEVRPREREAERERRRASHRADEIQLVRAIVDGIQLAPAIAGRCDDDGPVDRRGRDDACQRLATRHRSPSIGLDVRPDRSAVGRHRGRIERMRRHAALLHQQRIRLAGRVHVRDRAIEHGLDRVGLGREQLPRDLHRVEHRGRDRSHQRMLRLVRHAGLAAPRDDQQLRQLEGPRQRRQRAHRVAEARVLHHRDAARAARARRRRSTRPRRLRSRPRRSAASRPAARSR